MAALFRNRTWLAFLCVVVLLWMMVAPGAAGLPFALPIPLWICFGLILCFGERPWSKTCAPPFVPELSHILTRAPPRAF